MALQVFGMLDSRVQQIQSTLKSKGYGHLGMGVAGALMLFAFCPMSIVAVSAPYWTSSVEMQGRSMSSQASLWKVSVSTEIKGKSVDQDVDLCGDEMAGFNDCGKIEALRFLTIVALLLSLASGVVLVAEFSRVMNPSADLRRKLSLAGVSTAALASLCDFLGMCIGASVEMTGEAKPNGAGFVFLVLTVPFAGAATALVVCTLTIWSTKAEEADAPAVETPVVKVGKPDSEARKSPTLMSSPGPGAQKPTMDNPNALAPAGTSNKEDVAQVAQATQEASVEHSV